MKFGSLANHNDLILRLNIILWDNTLCCFPFCSPIFILKFWTPLLYVQSSLAHLAHLNAWICCLRYAFVKWKYSKGNISGFFSSVPHLQVSWIAFQVLSYRLRSTFSLQVGADPNLYCGGSSPLTSAAKEGDTKFLKRLLEAGSDPNSLVIFSVSLYLPVISSDILIWNQLILVSFHDSKNINLVRSVLISRFVLIWQDIFKPIEEAAIVHNRAAVEILFPVTERIAHYPNWTVDGIIEYIDSEDFRTMVWNYFYIVSTFLSHSLSHHISCRVWRNWQWGWLN